MQLSEEQFQSLIECMRPLGNRRPGEKRLHVRVGADLQVTIVPLDRSGPPVALQVDVRDVSRRGVSIRHSRPIKAGRQFILCLSVEDGQKTCTVICAVRRVRPLPTGKFEMGCEFTSEIQPPVPTDQIIEGLKKVQVKLLAADLDEV
jgi:hypothetical protein